MTKCAENFAQRSILFYTLVVFRGIAGIKVDVLHLATHPLKDFVTLRIFICHKVKQD